MKRFPLPLVCLCLWGLLSASVRSADPVPAPDPELRKFEPLVGRWRLDEVAEESPFGPADKASYVTSIQFGHAGFMVEERGEGKGLAAGPFSYSLLYHSQGAGKGLRAFYLDSTGFTVLQDGKFEGDQWTGHWMMDAKGKRYHCRSRTIPNPDKKSWTYEWSYSEDGKTWKPWLKGTASRLKTRN